MQSGCVICYDSFAASSEANNQQNDNEGRIVRTKCGHVFHNSCILDWLKRSRTCPECRRGVNRRHLCKLYINFCINNQPDNNALETLLEQLSGKIFECMKLEKMILTLKVDCALSDKKIEEKDKKIDELKASFAESKQQILEKDEKIKEIQTSWDSTELEILKKDVSIRELQCFLSDSKLRSVAKDIKINELQNYVALNNQEISAKGEKIEKLKTFLADLKQESLMKDQKIEELQTSFSSSKDNLEKKLQQKKDLENELSVLQKEVKRLNCVEVENQKLLQENNAFQNEKNTMMHELGCLNTMKTIVDGTFIDFKQILEELKIFSQYEKVATNVFATYCSLLKKALICAQEESTNLQNELTKVKQELAHSEDQKAQLQNKLKLVKRYM